jgi:hypothetical protein
MYRVKIVLNLTCYQVNLFHTEVKNHRRVKLVLRGGIAAPSVCFYTEIYTPDKKSFFLFSFLKNPHTKTHSGGPTQGKQEVPSLTREKKRSHNYHPMPATSRGKDFSPLDHRPSRRFFPDIPTRFTKQQEHKLFEHPASLLVVGGVWWCVVLCV